LMRKNLTIRDKNLVVLRTEVIRLFNINVRVNEILGKLTGFEEAKGTLTSRLEDAHKTLRSFIEQYEKKTNASS